MKKYFFIILIINLLFTACSVKDGNKTVSSESSIQSKEKFSDIIIQSPMTISNNDLFNINGEHQYLRLKMIKGRYYEDWNPGAYMGTLWEGYYIIELTDEFSNTIARTELSEIYNEPLIFNSQFQLQFDDYNNDGDIDFTIGQYVSSNGKNFRIFTLRNNGKIEELLIKDRSSLFISDTTGYYSVKLRKIDDISFKIEYYDNSKMQNCEEIFRWNGKKFLQDES